MSMDSGRPPPAAGAQRSAADLGTFHDGLGAAKSPAMFLLGGTNSMLAEHSQHKSANASILTQQSTQAAASSLPANKQPPLAVSKQEQERRNAAAEAERRAWERADAVAYELVLEEEKQKEREAAKKGASSK